MEKDNISSDYYFFFLKKVEDIFTVCLRNRLDSFVHA